MKRIWTISAILLLIGIGAAVAKIGPADVAALLIELGPAGTTDTTITRSAAGTVAVEGVDLLTSTSADALFLTAAEGNAAYQPLDADLTSWAGLTRATGFDTFVATPSSANIKSLVTDETGTGGALVFATAPDITISATTETNIESAIDTLANLTSAQGFSFTYSDPNADAFFGWDDSTGAWEALTNAEAKAALGYLTSTTDNVLPRYSGTTGDLDSSGITNNDDGNTFFAGNSANMGITLQNAASGATAQWTMYSGASGGASPGNLFFYDGSIVPLILATTTGNATFSADVSLGDDLIFTSTGDVIEFDNGTSNTFTCNSGHCTIESATVWDSGNDGAGSTLDADLLDGNNIGTSGATVPLLSTANTWSNNQTISNTSPAILLTDTTTGADARMQADDSGSLQYGADINNEAANTSINFSIDGTQRLGVTSAAIRPSTNDGLTLGNSTLQFSDIFIAEGAVINFDNGDVTVTQTGDSIAIAGGLLATPSHALTIATGAVTTTQSYAVIDTESSAATDDLDTISGGVNGAHLFVSAANDARTVVIKDGTGNIQGPGDCTLDNTQDVAQLLYNLTLTAWLVVACSNNGA